MNFGTASNGGAFTVVHDKVNYVNFLSVKTLKAFIGELS